MKSIGEFLVPETGDAEGTNWGDAITDALSSLANIMFGKKENEFWEDANMDPTMLTGGGVLPTRISYGNTNMSIAGFVGNQNDEVEGVIEIPHSSKLNAAGGTTVKAYFHAHAYANDDTGGDAKFGLEYSFTKEGVAVTESTTVEIVEQIPTTPWAKYSFNVAEITMPEELGSQFHFRFFRLGSDPLDTRSSEVAIATIGLHYPIDSFGSREVLVK